MEKDDVWGEEAVRLCYQCTCWFNEDRIETVSGNFCRDYLSYTWTNMHFKGEVTEFFNKFRSGGREFERLVQLLPGSKQKYFIRSYVKHSKERFYPSRIPKEVSGTGKIELNKEIKFYYEMKYYIVPKTSIIYLRKACKRRHLTPFLLKRFKEPSKPDEIKVRVDHLLNTDLSTFVSKLNEDTERKRIPEKKHRRKKGG